jgi:TetR/AcrR family transcriptional regulator, mexJK operon transcriptional repressor
MAAEHKRRGRPRDLGKLEAILDAAYALFLERGVAATTMDAVAERACVSKMTVYANFPDKPALLSAAFDRRVKVLHLVDLPLESDLESSLAHLIKVGETIVSVATQPEAIRMTRLLAEGADQHPQLAATYYTAGRGELLKRMSAFLKSLSARGFIAIKDPDLAAEQLMGAWFGMSVLRQSLGVSAPPSPQHIAKGVRYAVDTLIRAWSPSGSVKSNNKIRRKRT